MPTDTTSQQLPSLCFLRHILTTIGLALAAMVHGQDIAQIGKSDPLIISGAIGTQNT